MSTKQNFNDILRSKLIDRDLLVDEENWKNMRAMIDASRKRKMRRAWFLSSGALLLCCLGAYMLIPSSSETKQAAVPVNTSVQSLVKDKAITLPDANKEQPINTQSSKENKISSNVATSDRTIKEIATKNPYAKSTKTGFPLPPGSTVSSSINTQTPIGVPSNKGAVKNQVKQIKSDSGTQATLPIKKDSISAVAVINNKKDATPKQAKSDSIAPVLISKKDSIHKKTDSASKQITSPQTVSLPPLEEKPEKKNSLSIDAGAGYSFGWIDNNTTEGRNINPLIGIGYAHIISSSWSVKAGVQYGTLGSLNSTTSMMKHVNYDFGLNSKDTSVTTKRLYYITFPFQVEYKFAQKNAIGLGGSLSYLVSSSGTVEVSNISDNVASGNPSTYSQYLSTKGFNQWNASVYILYKRTIVGNISASLIPYFGLVDIKNNSFFMENTFERNSGIELIVSYNIL